jgi:hypothetical protein
MGAYSDMAIEGGAYLAPWLGRNLAGIMITPILIMGLFSEKTGRKLLLIVISGVLYFLTNTKDSLAEVKSINMEMVKSYVDVAWLSAAAGMVLIMALALGWKSFRPLFLTCLIAAAFLVPAPMGLIASYGIAKLVGWGMCENDNPQEKYYMVFGRGIIFAGFIVLLTFVGLSSETRVTWAADYGKIANKYRLNQEIVYMCDYVCDNEESDVKIYSFDIIDSEVAQYSVAACNGRLKNVSLGDVDQWNQDVAAEVLSSISSEGGYLMVYNFTEVDSSLMEENGIIVLVETDIYKLYGME